MSSTPTTLMFELADIKRKLDEASKPLEQRTAADKRCFARLLAGYKRRKAKLA